MPLTKEQLLIPRYLIISDYPFNTYYPVGKIILVPTDGYAENENGHPVFNCEFSNFPHIFRSLPWWERDESELPEYVKSIETGRVYKRIKSVKHYEGFEPADEADYLEYQKQKEATNG